MGVFSKITVRTEASDAELLCDRISQSSRKDAANLVEMIQGYVKNPEEQKIRPLRLFLDTVEMTLKNSHIAKMDNALDCLRYGEMIYTYVFVYEEATPNFDGLRNMFLNMFDENGVVEKRVFNSTLYELFFEKVNYCRWSIVIPLKNTFLKRSDRIVEFALRSRAFFPDEESFTVNLMYVTGKFMRNEADERIFEENMSELRRMAGIYEISEEKILSAEQKLLELQRAAGTMKDSLALVEERAEVLNDLSARAVKSADDYCKDSFVRMQTRIRNLSDEMDKEHRAFMDTQRQSILADKAELVQSVFNDSQAELTELKKTVSKMIMSAKAELLRANKESDSVMTKVQAFLENDERVQKMLANAQDSKRLNDRIDKLMVLNDSTIDYVADQVAKVQQQQSAPAAPAAPVAPVAPAAPAAPAASGPAVVTMQNITSNVEGNAAPAVPANVYVESDEMEPVSFILDETVPYQERWKEAMERKNVLVGKGEHFHTMFDDVLCAVIENANPYLIGPSGCGKTFMVHQIQEILGLESIDIGYINEEYDILGFQTANGGYSRPNFYRCYKYGKIAFCDELDNGNSRATVKLNSFLSNSKNASYSFPNGENVKRHPNFRIVAAGNTTGNGADANYNTREKIEESVQQRFTPIYVNYDNAVEKAILSAYPAWYEFVVAFRSATDAWARYSHAGAPGIITTRDTARIRKYLDNRSFSPSKILEYEFVQTKEPEYLAFLANEMKKVNCGNKDCGKLIQAFCNRVETIRSGKDTLRLF